MHPVFKVRPHVVAHASKDLTHSRALPDATLSALRAIYAGTNNNLPGSTINDIFFSVSNANVAKQKNVRRCFFFPIFHVNIKFLIILGRVKIFQISLEDICISSSLDDRLES